MLDIGKTKDEMIYGNKFQTNDKDFYKQTRNYFNKTIW